MNVGVIGSGAISDIYLENMIHKFDNLNVIAIASQHLENAQKKGEKFNISACSVEELLQNPEVELVVNLTPVGAHYQVIRDALNAGKHVYTEKTLTDDVEKARELLELADRKGRILASAPETFLGAALQTARKAIDEGMLGDIHSFNIAANRDNDILTGVFAFLRQPGAGILFDYGVYYMTGLVSLLGPVKRVGSMIAAPYPKRVNPVPGMKDTGKEIETPNESIASAVIQMANGITGTFHMNAETICKDQAHFVIYGKKGILYLTDPNQFGGQVRFLPNNFNFENSGEPVVLEPVNPYEDNYRGIGVSEMAKALAEGKENRASKEMAFHVQEALQAMLQSGKEGTFVDIISTMKRPEPFEG
ncbi:MAG: Gfo/Idh/MocA family oxidoreductase [Eubacteriales bacterium]|nr:Gfo/Idh/MocA family oxidoreductase [Eubacteriales bacterium]